VIPFSQETSLYRTTKQIKSDQSNVGFQIIINKTS